MKDDFVFAWWVYTVGFVTVIIGAGLTIGITSTIYQLIMIWAGCGCPS